ncbi:MFS transporter [Gordonia sinesedis]
MPARGWAALLLMITVGELPAMGFVLVTPALTDIATRFGTGQSVWVMTAYSLGGTVTVPLMSKLGDIYGRRQLIVICSVVSAVGAFGAAVAPAFGMLVAARFVQGAGFAIVPLSFALVRATFPPRIRALSVGAISAGAGIAGAVGPVLAGQLIDNGGYRAVFWAAAVVPIIMVPLVWGLVGESDRQPDARVDLIGALWLAVSAAAVLLAISNGGTWGWLSARCLGLLATALVAALVFIHRELRVAYPLIDMRLLSGRGVLPICVSGCAFQATIATIAVLIPMMLMTPAELVPHYGRGLTATEVAAFTTPGNVVTLIAGFLAGRYMRSGSIRGTMTAGSAVLAVATVALVFWHGSAAGLVLGYCLLGVGGGMMLASTPLAVLTAAPARSQAIAAGSVNMLQSLGSTAGLQAAFAILAMFPLADSGTAPLYTGTGYDVTLLYAAGLAIVAGIAASLWRPVPVATGRPPASMST